jgi:membrane protein required for beta-lactamase induction
MSTIAFATPLLPGMTGLDRDAMTSFQTGERKTDYEDARRRAGITREKVWIQTTPAGDMAIVYMEADDLDAAFAALGKSDEPFDRWFRDHVQRVHGFSLADEFHAPEQVLDFSA